tara:strand:- start:4306 stop:4638 length:333 start_codon:yes stop_codon:yes gene_type:complete
VTTSLAEDMSVALQVAVAGVTGVQTLAIIVPRRFLCENGLHSYPPSSSQFSFLVYIQVVLVTARHAVSSPNDVTSPQAARPVHIPSPTHAPPFLQAAPLPEVVEDRTMVS